jgi:hypothetical protein
VHRWLPLLAILLVCDAARAHGTGPQGMQPLDWHTEQIASVVSGHMALNVPGRVETIDGRSCMVGSHLHVDVLDPFAFDIDEPVRVEVEFALAADAATVALEHDGGAGPARQEVQLPVRGGRRFHAQEFALERARFAGLGPFGSDFSITAAFGPTLAFGTVSVCGISIERSHATPEPAPSGTLALELLDESGAPAPARVGLYDPSQRLPLPGLESVPVERFADLVCVFSLRPGGAAWPARNRQAFYVDGSYRARLPAGSWELVASRGLEWRIARERFEIEPGAETRLRVRMKRWADMPAAGWYSGDVHVHLGSGDAARDRDRRLAMQAEDLHVANLLQMGNIGNAHFRHDAFGPAARAGAWPYTLVPGQEDPRTLRRGHTIHLNLLAPVRDPARYYLYHEAFEQTRAQGGVTGYAHVDSLLGDGLGSRRGLALDVPFGLVDFIEVLQTSDAGTRTWFGFLDLGFALSPAAGSDYPYIDHPGAVRSYVALGEERSVDAWFAGLRAGRTFASNGPLLELAVNGRGMGSALRVEPGAELVVEARARLNPDVDRLARLELLEHGAVVAASESAQGAEELRLAHRLRASRGSWFVLRALGTRQAPGASVVAVSAPVYVEVAGGGFCDPAAVPALAAAMKQSLAEILAPMPDEELESEPWETLAPRARYWPEQVERLRPRVEQAGAVYDELAALASQQRCRVEAGRGAEESARRASTDARRREAKLP